MRLCTQKHFLTILESGVCIGGRNHSRHRRARPCRLRRQHADTASEQTLFDIGAFFVPNIFDVLGFPIESVNVGIQHLVFEIITEDAPFFNLVSIMAHKATNNNNRTCLGRSLRWFIKLLQLACRQERQALLLLLFPNFGILGLPFLQNFLRKG